MSSDRAGTLLGLAFSLITLVASCQSTGTAVVADRAWPPATTDLPLDPRVHVGRLDNGMRYAWANDVQPEDHCSLRLHFDVGSIVEEDDELGMAHFVEHMAFNGTPGYGPGELFEWIKRHGMTPGPDANGLTSTHGTYYTLDLIQSDAATVREALAALRGIADGIEFAPAEIEHEKAVIDSEARELDMLTSNRIYSKRLTTLGEGTRTALRNPMGVESVRATFAAERLRTFYHRWYRPEHATAILVGDFLNTDVAALLEQTFGSWHAAEAALPARPEPGEPTLGHGSWSLVDAQVPGLMIDVACLRTSTRKGPRSAARIADLGLKCANELLERRLRRRAAADDAGFDAAQVSIADDEHLPFEGEQLVLRCSPERAEPAVRQCRAVLNEALRFGFTDDELAYLRKAWLSGLDVDVEREEHESCSDFANAILRAVDKDDALIDAKTLRDQLAPAIQALTKEDARRALEAAWIDGMLVLGTFGGTDLGANGTDALRSAWLDAMREDVERSADRTVARWAYGAAATPAKVHARYPVERLGLVRVEFDNGVRLVVKHTDFKPGEILIGVYVGDGLCALANEQVATAGIATQAWIACGLGAHDPEELARLQSDTRPVAEPDFSSIRLEVHAFPAGLLNRCEVLCAYLKDPGWREAGWRKWQDQARAAYAQAEHDPWTPFRGHFLPAAFGGDRRMGPPTLAEFEAVDFEQAKAWLAPILESDRLDVGIVGDVDVEAAIDAAARTFGTLGERAHYADKPRPLEPARPGLLERYEIDGDASRALLGLLFPTCDGCDGRARAGLTLLAQVVQDRLFAELRERLGNAYAPRANAVASASVPNLGYLVAYAVVAPKELEATAAACLDVADTLAREGVTAAELERARAPAVERARKSRLTNQFWLDLLLTSQHTRSETLAVVEHEIDQLEAATLTDVSALGARYLTRENASQMLVTPKAR